MRTKAARLRNTGSKLDVEGRCLLDDAGVFIGFTSLPMRDEEAFVTGEIGELFRKYKERVWKNCADRRNRAAAEFKQSFYEPRAYYLFGHYDLAVFSLIDDFMFGVRNFTPFNPDGQNEMGVPDFRRGFSHQVLLGPTPKFKPSNSIVKLAQRTFLASDPLPLVAICQLKLSNELLISYGTDFLRGVVKAMYRILKKSSAESPGSFDFILLESYSWHEVTLLVFTDSFDHPVRLIPRFRELSLGRLKTLLDGEPERDALDSPSVLAATSRTRRDRHPDIEAGQPVFVTSSTTFGFSFDIGRQLRSRPKKNDLLNRIKGGTIEPFSRWFTRSGQFVEALRTVQQQAGLRRSRGKLLHSFGRGDLVHPTARRALPTRQFVRELIGIRSIKNLDDCVSAVYTVPTFRASLQELDLLQRKPQSDPIVHRHSTRRLVGSAVIDEVKQKLKTLHVPKAVNQGVLNLLSIYNQGIQDDILYGHFLELLPFVESLLETVKSAPGEVRDLNRFLIEALHSFEYAYANRFYSSYRSWEVSDSNLFFKGGIQQLVTAYDGLYKAMSTAVGNPRSFAFVEGRPNMATWEWALRLSFFHIFQPELLATSVLTEAAMHYIGTRTDRRRRDVLGSCALPSEDAETNTRIRAERLKHPLGNYLTPNWFNHVIADLFAFNLAYLRDAQLYSWWYWNYFAASEPVYRVDGSFLDEPFHSFLLRQLVVFRLSGVNQRVVLPSPELRAMHRLRGQDCEDFVDRLFEKRVFADWFDEAVRSVNDTTERCFGASARDYAALQEPSIRRVMDLFRQGVVHPYRRNDEWSRFKFTQLVLHAYLRLLKEWKHGATSVLPRVNGVAMPPKHAALLFDPLGGVFVNSMRVRRQCFQYRNVLTMSIWDMAVKEKRADWIAIHAVD